MSTENKPFLSAAEWTSAADEHVRQVNERWGAYFESRSRQVRHAIFDFLFEYYSFRLARLQEWTPGIGVAIELRGDRRPVGKFWDYRVDHAVVSIKMLTEEKRRGLQWILTLLESTASKTPSFACGGMHEWAMVYRSRDVRHSRLPLRLPHDAIDRIVENSPIGCSHFDAFRFFTTEAVPLNRFRPSRELQPLLDQPGCLHVTMDLYKWAHKAHPWISSEIVLQALDLATEARILDMQASPYDVSTYGFQAVPIETPEGRAEYARRQKELAEKAIPLRERIIAAYTFILQCGKKEEAWPVS